MKKKQNNYFYFFEQEEENRGKPNYEHLDEDLHVILQCEDYENRAIVKLEQAKNELNKLLKPPVNIFYLKYIFNNFFFGLRLKVKII